MEHKKNIPYEPLLAYSLTTIYTAAIIILGSTIYFLTDDNVQYPPWIITMIQSIQYPLSNTMAITATALVPLSIYRRKYYMIPLHAWFVVVSALIAANICTIFAIPHEGRDTVLDTTLLMVAMASTAVSIAIAIHRRSKPRTTG